jgi:glycerol-3-phosphate dehydrogenase
MSEPLPREVDLLVVGGGINGTGVARDAAGRGLSTLLVERDDLAAATSQWSTKLIHGGLRYLEYYEFRLVAESLAEREVLIAQAPHLVEAMSFMLAHEPHLRPAWMIRSGLFLYDHIAGRKTLPGSFGVDLTKSRWGAGLKKKFRKGFVYADARVDDARLVVATTMAARRHGATVRTRTRFTGATRDNGAWRATLQDGAGSHDVRAKAIVNVTGPWVADVLRTASSAPTDAAVRHVKGSHIVVPRVHEEAHAYLLQNADKRIVFIIPWLDRYSLIGTTDVPVNEYEHPEISEDEVEYLLKLANEYLDKPLSRKDVVWTFSGIRPLYDDGKSDPKSITRDYVLKVDAGAGGREPPVLSIYGGKLTTYRKLAEAALQTLRPWFPAMKPAWTEKDTLPGGDLPTGPDRNAWIAELGRRYPQLPPPLLRDVGRRHVSIAAEVLGDARKLADLGRDFGGGLTEREIDHLVRNEWARSADDVLYRRTKCGLWLGPGERRKVAEFLRG